LGAAQLNELFFYETSLLKLLAPKGMTNNEQHVTFLKNNR